MRCPDLQGPTARDCAGRHGYGHLVTTDHIVVVLSDPEASSPALTGAKASNIARCAVAGLPTLPGFVITTIGVIRGLDDPAVVDAAQVEWERLGGTTGTPVVVRSSSTIEDAGESSMAGRFTSVLDVTDWDGFLDAARRVILSADAVRDADGIARPLAVLVQQQLITDLGGVMFGVDPVTGRRDHVVVEAVSSRPDSLVSGMATADHYVLSPRGRIVRHTRSGDVVDIGRRQRRELTRLAAAAARVFGSPQDVEWAVDRDGRLWLLQSRPVTAVAATEGRHSVVLGPGPTAETFPDPLTPLEDDLWVPPLREGIARALTATGAVPPAALARSPVVTTIGRRVAVDLTLLGATSGHAGFTRRLSPAAIVRRLTAAWRVGRLRVALPHLAATVVDTVDRDLETIVLDGAGLSDLVDLLRRSRDELATVHAYEVLCGMLLRERPGTPSATSIALRSLHEGRSEHRSDAEIIHTAPVVLALSAPSLTAAPRLPATAPMPPGPTARIAELSERDALRLRVRWLHELQCRIVHRIGDELLRQSVLSGRTTPDRETPAWLRLDELEAVARGERVPMAAAAERRAEPLSAPLPTAFHVSTAGGVLPVRPRHTGRTGRPTSTTVGLPAGGGRRTGVVVHRLVPGSVPAASTAHGTVLVTRFLEPQLAPLLPYLQGLVAETGSALSHLAILAREMGVATVVDVPGALQRFAPGTHVLVDGTTGAVDVLDPAPLASTASTGTASTGTGVTA